MARLADTFPDDFWGRRARRLARVERAGQRIDGTTLLERERAMRKRYKAKARVRMLHAP